MTSLRKSGSSVTSTRAEIRVHAAFQLTLVAKAAFAALEMLGGIATYLVPQDFLMRTIERITRNELLEDPRDFVARHLWEWVQGFSVSSRHFAALYLLSHGIVKLWLVVGLLRQKVAYYPIAIAVFSAFVAYQVYRYQLTHSISLVIITAIDMVVIALTWHEYRVVRQGDRTRT